MVVEFTPIMHLKLFAKPLVRQLLSTKTFSAPVHLFITR